MKSKNLYILSILFLLVLLSSCSSQKDNGCGYWGANDREIDENVLTQSDDIYVNHRKSAVSE